MTTKITIGIDGNGNRIVRVKPATGRAFAIQTNGNLPATHRDGITAATLAEIAAHVAQYGTAKHRAALDLLPMSRYYIQRNGKRMKNYHGKEEKIEGGEYVFHVTDQGEIVRAHVDRVDGEILELAFSDYTFGCELFSTCYRDENQCHFVKRGGKGELP